MLPDLAAAVVLGALSLSALVTGSGERDTDAFAVLLVLVASASLLVARRHPLPVLAVTLAASLVIEAMRYPADYNGLTALWALYVVALLRTWQVSLAAALVVGTLVVTTVWLSLGLPPAMLFSAATSVAIAWVLGAGNRSRRSRLLAEERAASAEERAGIAREMQDLVAHELAEMTVQVTAARRVVGSDPEAADRLLSGAEETARAVVGEARRILAVLSSSEGTPDRAPLPGLDDLPELVGRHADAGLFVDLQATTPAPYVGAGPALLAYRTVEETLAEATRARARTAEVSVGTDDGLQVRVRHDGAPATGSAPVRSVGLERRAQLYGGTVGRRVDAAGTTVVLQIPAAGTRRTTT